MATGLPYLTAKAAELAEAYSLLVTLAEIECGRTPPPKTKKPTAASVPAERVDRAVEKTAHLLADCLDAKRDIDLNPLQNVHPEICFMGNRHALSWTEMIIDAAHGVIDVLSILYGTRDGNATELDPAVVAADWSNAARSVRLLAVDDALLLANLIRKESSAMIQKPQRSPKQRSRGAGRPSEIKRNVEWAREYEDGLEATPALWTTKRGYWRSRHKSLDERTVTKALDEGIAELKKRKQLRAG